MKKEDFENLKEIIIKNRKKANLNQKDLAKKISVSYSLVKKIEGKNYLVTPYFLEKFLILKNINKKDRSFMEKYITAALKEKQSKKKKEKNVNHATGAFVESLINKIESLEKEVTSYKTATKSKNYMSYEDKLKQDVFLDSFNTTTRIIPLMWELRDTSAKTFSELELLLEINNPKNNIQMKKGLTKIGKDLIEIGKKLQSYTEEGHYVNEVEDVIEIK